MPVSGRRRLPRGLAQARAQRPQLSAIGALTYWNVPPRTWPESSFIQPTMVGLRSWSIW